MLQQPISIHEHLNKAFVNMLMQSVAKGLLLLSNVAQQG
jgi:hypothetical protein